MPFAQALRCRECGREYPLEPLHVCEFCFGPLEVAYDYDAMHRNITRESDRARPALRSGGTPTCCPSTPADAVDIKAGLHAAGPREEPRRAPRPQEPLHQERLRQPDLVLQGSRRHGRGDARRASSASTTLACASTGNLAEQRLRPRRRAPACEAFVFIPRDLERGKILGSERLRRRPSSPSTATTTTSTASAREIGATSTSWAFVNINMRPVLRRGQQDARLRGRRAARLARARPRRRADGSRLALREDLEGPAGAGASSGSSTASQTKMSGAQARGCSPIVTACEDGTMNIRPGASRRRSPSRSPSAIRPTATTRCKIMQESGGRGVASDDEEIVEGIKLLAESEGHLRARRPAA